MSGLATVLQILSVIAAIFALVVSIIHIFNGFWLIPQVIIILFALSLLLAEVYAPGFFKYFGFLFKYWGKAYMYLLIAGLNYGTSGLSLITMIIFLALFVIYILLSFAKNSTSAPFLQANSGMSMDTSTRDYFNTV